MLSAQSIILWSVFAIGSTLTYLLLFRECATPPHVQVHDCTQFYMYMYQAFPHVSTASNKRWCEKAWVRGYVLLIACYVVSTHPCN